MKHVLIYGTGQGYNKVKNYLKDDVEIIGFVDSYKNGEYLDKPLYKVEEIASLTFDYVVVASITFEKEMVENLNIYIPSNKIVLISEYSRYLIKNKKNIFEEFFNYKENQSILFNQNFFAQQDNIGIVAMNKNMQSKYLCYDQYPNFNSIDVDYVRLATIDLLAREVKEKKIKGAIAELGVYKGNLTKFLLANFENRKIVLLDTFEGFNEKDIQIETQKNDIDAQKGHFGDVNIQEVQALIEGYDVDLVKGYFPGSVGNYRDQTYAFVSIDVDLYQPILSGLEYFYPRLSKGGYIIIHDYNYKNYPGVKQAVREFEEKYSIVGIPLCDFFGSYIFVK